MSYYKTIDGKKMNSGLLDTATRLVQGSGDGRISVNDAEVLMNMVKADNVLTYIEKETIEYILHSFKWTSSAEEWFHHELKAWKSKKAPVPITVAELSKKSFTKTDVLSDPDDIAERNHMLVAATSETNQDHDEIGLWIRLSDGTTVQVLSNFIELEGEFVQLHGGCLVPVRAIEKVEM